MVSLKNLGSVELAMFDSTYFEKEEEKAVTIELKTKNNFIEKNKQINPKQKTETKSESKPIKKKPTFATPVKGLE